MIGPPEDMTETPIPGKGSYGPVIRRVAIGRPGSETVLATLSELLFAETVRR
jgi:hypothetical protein